RSPQLHEKFKRLAGLSPLLDVCTRWGSTYDMIQRAHQCKGVYLQVLHDAGEKELILDKAHWDSLRKLMKLLQRFHIFTTALQYSKGEHASINRTVPAYNTLMETIENFRQDYGARFPALDRAAEAAYEKLKTYYRKTDLSPIYAVVTALDPKLRFGYWKDQEWGPYEVEAKAAVRQVWRQDYQPKATTVSRISQACTSLITGDDMASGSLDQDDDFVFRTGKRKHDHLSDEEEDDLDQLELFANAPRR
ncbi:hypothetical protein DFQ26_002156, partial [Actinomortierella ambigua]